MKKFAIDDKHKADQMMIEVGLVEKNDVTNMFSKKSGDDVWFL